MMQRKVRNPPEGRLGQRSPDRHVTYQDEDVAAAADDDDDDDYSDDFEEDEGEKDEQERDELAPSVIYRTIRLDNGFQLLVPEDGPSLSEHPCKMKSLSAEQRTELLSDFKHIGDDIMISDAYEVTDLAGCITTDSSRMKLRYPVVLPTTRLNHADLFRFHVMARERNGDWKKVPAHYQNSELTFPLNGVKSFVAYAQPIPEFTNVTSSGFTFKSAKSDKISVEIPEGAVDGEAKMTIKVYPVNMDRMNAMDREAFSGIHALSDILYVRHTMDNVLKPEGSVILPLDRVDKDHEVKILTGTPGYYKIANIDKDLRNGHVKMQYKGEPKMSCQALCVSPGMKEEDIIRHATYLTGKTDACTILFFLSKLNKDRFLTVEFVDMTFEEGVLRNRSEHGFYEIKNSRRNFVEVGKKRRIRVDLGGNLQSADVLKNTRFSFVYNSGCENNSLQFKMAKNSYCHSYSIVEVIFDGRQVHTIHFEYPDVGQSLGTIKNSFLPPDNRYGISQSAANASDSGYNTDRSGTDNSHKSDSGFSSTHQDSHSTASVDTKSKSEPETLPESTTPKEPRSTSEAKLISEAMPIQSRPQQSLPPVTQGLNVSDQRPITAFSEVSTIPERGHPLLEEASLSMLGKNLLPEDVTDLLIRADFKEHEIIEIRRTATANYFNPNMRLLVEWKRKQKNELLRSDSETLDCLEKDFDEINRTDVAAIIKRLREREQPRIFKKKDFVNL